MEIKEISERECRDILERASMARLGCSQNDQPYVVPIYITCDGDNIYIFSTVGKKIEWMRANPRVCLQVDEISAPSDWASVIVNGHYEELPEPQHSEERAHARKLVEQHHGWWLNALGERRITIRDQDIEPVFFRIRIASLSGLRSHA
ncbi:MAG TPA: pyridoxamine 5'-phosphate oxidase family protein [Terriglobales bacterium]|nr:pyridoxamine 5'-phosphate oxidase family protein [Terriglobales bacterium]